MAMQFSHSVGYRGLCQVKCGGGNDYTTFLCTGGSIQLSQEPIMASGVWGAGYANIAPIAYAFNYLSLEGSANFELTTHSQWQSTESEHGVWNTLKKFAFTDRTSDENSIKLLPDGKNGFSGHGWCSQLGFDASEGAAVTGNFSFKGDPGADGNGIQATTDVKKLGLNNEDLKYGLGTPQESDLVGATLVPYWNTTLYAKATTGEGDAPNKNENLPDITQADNMVDDVISWSCSYNSDLQPLKCCKNEENAPISADYILAGEMSCDGNFTVFGLRQSNMGGFDPATFHQTKQYLTFVVRDHRIIIPFALIQNGSTSMTTGAQYISCEFSFNGIGDGYHSVMTMV